VVHPAEVALRRAALLLEDPTHLPAARPGERQALVTLGIEVPAFDLLFRPATLITWHRAAVRQMWIFRQNRKPERPRIDPELKYWIVRLAKENSGLGYDKLEGELAKLGFTVSRGTVKNVMIRHDIPPP
jgi:putative transposase